MKFIVGKSYYTRNGKVAEITRSDAVVEGYVANGAGDDFKLWGADGRRSSTRRSPIDLTEAVALPPSLAAPEVRRVPAAEVGFTPMLAKPGPEPVRGYVAEFVSNRPGRYISPVFDTKWALDRFVEKSVTERGCVLVRITTVAEVPQELCA